MTRPDVGVMRDLLAKVGAGSELDPLTCAHLTAALVAPPGSYVTRALITNEIRVCVGQKPQTRADDVWSDWPAWRLRWAAGELDAAFGLMERTLTGANFIYGRGRKRASEPAYGCQFLFGSDEVLGEAEHDDGASCVVAALLTALIAQEDRHG